MALRLVFMGTPDFAVPTLAAIVGRGHDVAAVYTRAPKPAGRGMDVTPSPVEREARRFGLPVLTPVTLKTPDAEAAMRAHGAAGSRRRGLWPDPAASHSRRRFRSALQSARLAAAALARRRTDQPRDHGGRPRERRHRDEDGRRSRHRRIAMDASAADRAPPDRARHDGGRTAR